PASPDTYPLSLPDALPILLATAVFPVADGGVPARLGLIARGDLSRMDVGIGGRAPRPLRASLSLGGNEDAPTWQLRARSEGLDPDRKSTRLNSSHVKTSYA